MSRPKGPRGLRPEEAELWDTIARRTRPLKPKSPAKIEKPPPPVQPVIRAEQPPTPIEPFQLGSRSASGSTTADLAPTVRQALTSAPVAMDRKAHKKLQRGKLKPEARIDLHGMTLSVAHPALIRFISESYAKERRLVLVITGKGKDRDPGGPIPVRPGVLRHQVPAWLAAPPLGSMVLQVTPAHLRHGGDGAIYVYLKRRR